MASPSSPDGTGSPGRWFARRSSSATAAFVVPLVVTAQAFAGDAGDRAIREVVAAAHEAVSIDLDRAAEAAALMRGSGHRDAVDALVAAEALRRVPSIVVTSDPDNLRRLLDADAAGHRVAVWRV